MLRFARAYRKRTNDVEFASLDRLVRGTSWGVAIAHDHKRKNSKRWATIVRNRSRSPVQSLEGEALERAVARVAEMFPENVLVGSS